MKITEVLVTPQALSWLPWAAQYFFYIGSAYAASILFGVTLVYRGKTSHRLRSALVLTMAISAIVGALALTADLHQPARAWHFYAYFSPWSWMSLGAIFLPVFCILCVITAWLYLRDDLRQLKSADRAWLRLLARLSLGSWSTSYWVMLGITMLTALSGLSIAIYTGAEVAIIKARPLWHQSATPLLWFVTAFFGAIGLTLMIMALQSGRHHEPELKHVDQQLMIRTLRLAGVLSVLLLSIWASNSPHFSLYSAQTWFNSLVVLYGSYLLITFLPYLISLNISRKIGLLSMALIAVTASGFTRWVTMIDVQRIAKFDAGIYPYELPLGSAGLAGIFGMIGLWVALAVLTSDIINPHPSHSSRSSLVHE
ncbi:NrfD/PsrC family molybdoenzyme membrane anchor subunit [Vibrio mediterranei]|uniref:NrfD/PsrC family molybdoenzyme membrane anchor subunit n=1 Tax=Vibrio mediterranei TaxID=689 RepID=UPI004068B5A6